MNDGEMLKRKLGRLRREPSNHELYNDIGVLLYKLKDYENASKYLARACELSPSDTDVLFNYAHALYDSFEWRKAVAIFCEYLKFWPEDKTAIEKTADAYYQLGEYGLAARYECLLLQ